MAGECKFINTYLTCISWAYFFSHVEGYSTVFGTGLNYTVLRLLGVDAEHPVCVKARATLHKLGRLSIEWYNQLLSNIFKVVLLQSLLGGSFGYRY